MKEHEIKKRVEEIQEELSTSPTPEKAMEMLTELTDIFSKLENKLKDFKLDGN